MASKSNLIREYCKTNGVSEVDFREDVKLQDDSNGQGAYIKEWNIEGLAQPTDEQLASYENAANTEEANNIVRSTRRTAYGDIGEQLDEIYKDIDSWKARIKSIKDANPKS
nr:phage protein XkdW-like protein [uncultured Mediterranean phage uvMED]